MNKYYLTFGQKYPWRNGYVLVIAKDYNTAREYVESIFKEQFSFLYHEKDFKKDFFPAGQLGETIM